MRIVVVLPDPLRPTNPTIRPSGTSKETPSSATTSSNRRRRSISSSTGEARIGERERGTGTPPPSRRRGTGRGHAAVTDVVGEVEPHLGAYLLRDVVQIAFVPLRQDDLRESCPVRGEHLLLHAADRQNPTLEGDLAGHPDGRPDRLAGEQRDERGRHRDSGAGSVLRNRTRGHVDVEPAGEPARIDPELRRVRA